MLEETATTKVPLLRIVYASAAKKPYTKEELRKLLDKARANNHRTEVTGMLLYCEGSFLQTLEGDPEAVGALYARIARDPKHHRMTLLLREEAEERCFDAWSMGYAEITREEARRIPGLSDFFLRGRDAGDANAPRVLEVLQAFKDNRYRSR